MSICLAALCVAAAPQQYHRQVIKTNKAAAGGPAIAFVQTASDLRSGFITCPIAFASDVTAGSAIILGFSWTGSTTVSSVADNRSNTYNLVVSRSVTTSRHIAVYAAYGVAAGSTTVTVTSSAAASNAVCTIGEFTGVTAVDTTIAGADGSTSTNPANAGNITPTVNNTLVIAAYGFDAATGGVTAGSGLTLLPPDTNRQCVQYEILSGGAGVAQNTECTMSATLRNWTGVAATFKQ